MKKRKQRPPAARKQRNLPLAVNPETKNKPSITRDVRRMVVSQPNRTTKEIIEALVQTGWDSTELNRRTSTIATLRADALAVLRIAQETGWSMRPSREKNS